MCGAVTMSEPRIAIVHDALVNSGGAERVVTFMCEAFPNAPVFTSAYLPDQTFPEFRSREIHVLPGADNVSSERDAKRRLPQWLWGFQRLDLSAFDIVLSSTTFAAKHVRPPKNVRHVSYCYAPFRLLWKPAAYETSSLPVGAVGRTALALARPALRAWDTSAMNRISAIATTAEHGARDCRCYHRDAEIIYAPVRLSDYRVGSATGRLLPQCFAPDVAQAR